MAPAPAHAVTRVQVQAASTLIPAPASGPLASPPASLVDSGRLATAINAVAAAAESLALTAELLALPVATDSYGSSDDIGGGGACTMVVDRLAARGAAWTRVLAESSAARGVADEIAAGDISDLDGVSDDDASSLVSAVTMTSLASTSLPTLTATAAGAVPHLALPIPETVVRFAPAPAPAAPAASAASADPRTGALVGRATQRCLAAIGVLFDEHVLPPPGSG